MALTNRDILTIQDLSSNDFTCVGNKLRINFPPDVLTTLGYNGATGELTYVDEAGTSNVINLPLENFLAAASFNPATNILTLTLTDGSTVDVDLSGLVDTVDVCAELANCTIGGVGNVAAGADSAAKGDLLMYDTDTSEWTSVTLSSLTLDCSLLTP